MALPTPLLIRPAQMRALGQFALDGYLQRLADHVALVFPGHAGFVRSRRGARFLRDALARARGYGLHDAHSITLFIDLAVALGEDFDREPAFDWIRSHLQAPGLGAAAKMFLIYKDLPERCPGEPLPPPPFDDDESDPDSALPVPAPLVPRSQAPYWWGDRTP
jgi:hypothetical protein